MAIRRRDNNDPTLNSGFVALSFFRGSGPVLLRNPKFLWFFRGGAGPRVPPSGSTHGPRVSVHCLSCNWTRSCISRVHILTFFVYTANITKYKYPPKYNCFSVIRLCKDSARGFIRAQSFAAFFKLISKGIYSKDTNQHVQINKKRNNFITWDDIKLSKKRLF